MKINIKIMKGLFVPSAANAILKEMSFFCKVIKKTESDGESKSEHGEKVKVNTHRK